jgi:hypothetical protein
MLVPCFVRLRYYFYPIGNTPALNLLRDASTAPTAECKILCLGSGDARNVLFTLWTEPSRDDRLIHFTTCDYEPAVLARNIFLFSYLMSDQQKVCGTKTSTEMLWNMYYHMFVTSDVLSAMIEHLEMLLKASGSIDDWTVSPCGGVLRFLGASSLFEMRTYWGLYLDAARRRDQIAQIREEIAAIHEPHSAEATYHLSGVRSGGLHGIAHYAVLGSTFRAYWKTGVVAGNQQDVSALQREKGGHTNPLLLVSSAPRGDFAMHYGTDPIFGYNVAPALDDSSDVSNASERLAMIVKAQFHDWCVAFVQHARAQTVQISFHCGDALALCHTLQRRAAIPPKVPEHLYSYIRPWSAVPISLDRRLDSYSLKDFHVIDTSNISDHIGILNLLPAAVPLLSSANNAVLYTETLLPESLDPDKYCDELLRADTKAICILMNLAPVGYLLGTSTEHFGTEAAADSLSGRAESKRQKRMRLTWKHPGGGDHVSSSKASPFPIRPSVEHRELASFLFQWYLNIFSPFEDISRRFRSLGTGIDPFLTRINFNSRTTLVALIGLIRQRIETDWQACLQTMLEMIESDRSLLIGSNSLQELYTLLQMSGLMDISAMKLPPHVNAGIHAAAFGTTALKNLKRYPNLPNVICVVLIVPRAKLNVITSMSLDQLSTPGLQLNVHDHGTFDNSFFALHTCFGKLLLDKDLALSKIEEDPAGWKGKADLLVSCMIPSFYFLLGREGGTQISLRIIPTVASTPLASTLGMFQCVYQTSVNDRKNVQLLPSLPNVVRSPGLIRGAWDSALPSPAAVHLSLTSGTPEKFTLRATFEQDKEQEDLKNRSPVTVQQVSPCSMAITFGDHSRELRFPFPVNGRRCHTKISRKQCWVEISVALTSAAQHAGGYTLSPFPLISDRGQLVPWMLGKVNLSKCPIIPSDANLPYLESFIGMSMSQKEKMLNRGEVSISTHEKDFFDFKKSIAVLFIRTQTRLGQRRNTHNVFRMTVNDDCDFLIFTNGIHHDQAVGSICLGAYVLPLTAQTLGSKLDGLGQLFHNPKQIGISISKGEETLWKQAMPALVERCRYDWEHKPSCEYNIDGVFKCPRSVKHSETPICSCGEGHDTDLLPSEYAFFAPYVTRVAIPILSALPYVEPMAFTIAPEAYATTAKGSGNPVTAVNHAKNSTSNSSQACDYCRSPSRKLSICKGCNAVWYCDRDCQKAGWKAHKSDCKKNSATH